MTGGRDHLAEVKAARDEAGREEERRRRSRDETEARIDRFVREWNVRSASSPHAAMRFRAWKEKVKLLESSRMKWGRKLTMARERTGAPSVGWRIDTPRIKGRIEIKFLAEIGDEADMAARLFVAKRTGLIAQQPPRPRERLVWDFDYEILDPPTDGESSWPAVIVVHREWAEEWPEGEDS